MDFLSKKKKKKISQKGLLIPPVKITRMQTGPQKISHVLLKQDAANNGTSKGVSAQCLFDLLQSLEGDTPDILDILELVKAEKPLKSLGNSKESFIQ